MWWRSDNLSTMRYGILWREAMHIVRMSPETYKCGICFAFEGRHKRTGISHTFRLCSKQVCIITARPNVCIHLSWVWTLQFEIPIGWFWGGIRQCNDNKCKIPKMPVFLWIGLAQHHKSLSFRGVTVCFLLYIEHAIHMHWDIKCWSYNQPQGYKVHMVMQTSAHNQP